MNPLELLRISIDSLITNRLRSFLTILGMTIGVGAVIALVSLGRGVEAYVAQEFGALGSNLLTINSSRPSSPTRTRIEPLTTIEALDLANPSIAPSIARIGAEFRLLGLIEGTAGQAANLTVRGVTDNFAEIQAWALRDGAFITALDVREAARVAVLGVDAVERLFGDKNLDPTGEEIRVSGRAFTVIGVMSELDAAFSDDDESVLVPISTAHTRLDNARTRDGGYRLSRIYVQTISEDAIESARREIAAYLNQAHNIIFSGEEDYTIANQGDLLNFFRLLTGILTIFLSLIAGISLLVAGIGVMNIMLVSVTERTREIGLRKAVGARYRDILTQFLIEALVLTLVGGVFGVLIGFGAAQIGRTLVPDLTLEITLDVILLATLVSSTVGIVFGLYPANRAARMKPIDALRFE
jgi:putative ABC transport system permease protein